MHTFYKALSNSSTLKTQIKSTKIKEHEENLIVICDFIIFLNVLGEF